MDFTPLKNIFNLTKQFFGEKYHFVADDPRPDEEKSLDYTVGLDFILPSGGPGVRITELPFIPQRQDKSSACGAFSAAHVRKFGDNSDVFPLSWYRTRSNYSSQGMYLKDVLKLAALADTVDIPKKTGAYTETYANSLPLLDLYNNTRKDKYEYITISPYKADDVFQAVSAGYAVVVSFYSTINEWREEMYVRDYTIPSIASVRHFVTAIPNSNHTQDGYEWISVVDSSPQFGFNLRHVRKDFLEARMYHGAGFYTESVKKVSNKKDVPENRCNYGESNTNVLALQTFLNQEGLLSTQHMTGYYGPITAGAVLNWQLKYISTSPVGRLNLLDLGGKYWGPLSIVKATELYK